MEFSVKGETDDTGLWSYLVITPTRIKRKGIAGIGAFNIPSANAQLDRRGWLQAVTPHGTYRFQPAAVAVSGAAPIPEMGLFARASYAHLQNKEWMNWVELALTDFNTAFDKATAVLGPLGDRYLQKAKEEAAFSELDADFANALQFYQSASPKPTLPEDARRFQVQAESAVRDKSFAEAAKLYASALRIAAWWPEGHFNIALVLAETGDFATAIVEMKHYLALVPDAPDARAAQDKVYEWERRANVAPRGGAHRDGKTIETLGVSVRELSAMEMEQLHTTGTVLVIDSDDSATMSGLHPGDVILGVERKPIASVTELEFATHDTTRTISVLVQSHDVVSGANRERIVTVHVHDKGVVQLDHPTR